MTSLIAPPRPVPAPGGGPLDNVQLHIVDSLDVLDECRRWAGERRDVPLCYDTESGGLSPYHHRMRRVQLGDLHHGWSFRPGWQGAAVEILQRYDGRLGAANASYDNRVLARHTPFRPRWDRTDDVIIAGRLADSLRPAALKMRAAIEVDPRAMAAEEIMAGAMARQHWTWDTIPDSYEPYDLYAAMDPVLTAHLWLAFRPVMQRFGAAYDLELATARICAAMMDTGMMIDVPFITAKIGQIDEYLGRVMPWLAARGITSVNSNEQVGAALAEAGIRTTVVTAGGKPSVAKDTLRLYAHAYPEHAELLQAILWARKGAKIRDSYLQKFLDLRTPGDIVHYTINTIRARTHRQSVQDPPMQTFDRDEPVIRGSWIPRPGMALVTMDADQIEARLAAHFSGDPAMIAEFRRCDELGLSFFVEMSSRIYGEPVAKKDLRYTLTKNATYGQIYGSSLATAAITAGVPVEQMRQPYEGFRQLYPGVGRMMQQIIGQARQMRGGPAVQALDGRWLRIERGKEYGLQDYKIQGSAAVVMKYTLVKLDAAGYGPYMRLPVHDEVLSEVPREQAAEMLADMTRIATDRDNFAVALTWGGSVLDREWVKT